MGEPIIINGIEYEQQPFTFNGRLEGWIALKPLPKQPEEEKQMHTFTMANESGHLVIDQFELTNHQAQLAADAVKEVLRYIRDGTFESDTMRAIRMAHRNNERGK